MERYAYDYRPEELAEWVPRIRMLHEGGRPVHLLMNNLYRATRRTRGVRAGRRRDAGGAGL